MEQGSGSLEVDVSGREMESGDRDGKSTLVDADSTAGECDLADSELGEADLTAGKNDSADNLRSDRRPRLLAIGSLAATLSLSSVVAPRLLPLLQQLCGGSTGKK